MNASSRRTAAASYGKRGAEVFSRSRTAATLGRALGRRSPTKRAMFEEVGKKLGGARGLRLSAASDTLQDASTQEGYPDSRGSNQVYFYKYQGLGNDFIMVDNRHCSDPIFSSEEAVALCDRRFGIGGDGIIFLMNPPSAEDLQTSDDDASSNQVDYDYAMRMYNSDGTEPEMCGNGIRCLARFVAELEEHSVPRSYKFHTLAGTIIPEVNPNGLVSVDMGEPRIEPEQIPTTLAASGENEEYQSAVVLQELEVGGDLEAVPSPEEMFSSYEERMENQIKRRTKGVSLNTHPSLPLFLILPSWWRRHPFRV